MFKKFFSGLAESKEQKQRARYLDSFDEFANSLADQRAPILADTARRVAQAKHKLDTSELVEQASKSLEVDFDQLATNLCDRIRDKITELAKHNQSLTTAVCSMDEQQLATHQSQWQTGLRTIQVAYAALHRTGADKLSPQLESLTENYETSTPIGQAIEALLLEVRTAERIRNELG